MRTEFSLASYNPTTRNGVVVVSTGATSYRDSQGVYKVCSNITKYVYTYINNKKKAETTTTTTTTTSATDITSSATDITVSTTVSTAATTSATDVTTAPTTESTGVSVTDITQTSTTVTGTSESQTTVVETTTAAVTTTTTSVETESTTAATTAATANMVKVTGAVVNVRAGAGTGKTIITTVKKGKIYEYTATTKVGSVTWYKINVSSSVSGWISGIYAVKVNTAETAATTVSTTAVSKNRVKISVSNLNVRKGAGTKYGIVTVVKKGKIYEYTTTKKVGGKTWYKIKVSNTISGWVCGTYVKKVN